MAEEPKVDMNVRVGQYVALRDVIKDHDTAHKEKMKPYRETLEKLNSALLDHLNDIGADSAKTGSGTVYRTAKKSASVKDMAAFWAFVVANADFDLVDKKANSTGVANYIDDNGTPPPGVNFTVTHVVGVRRK